MRNIAIGIMALLLLISGVSEAQQDIHFSQWRKSPMNLNPATAGVFYGTYRFTANYRQQWLSISTPYTTYAASVDFPIVTELLGNDLLGVGVSFNQDEAGDAFLKSTRGYATLTYGKALDVYEEHFFSIGFQAGLVGRSIDYDNNQVYWDSQWQFDGFNLGLPTGEVDAIENFGQPGFEAENYADLNAGIYYAYNSRDVFKMQMGLSMMHVNRPDLDLLGNPDELDRRIVGFWSFDHSLRDNSHFVISPGIVYSNQQNNHIFIAGADMKFLFNQATKFTGYRKEMSMDLGAHYRWNDAIIGVFRLNFGGLTLGASYDLNLSPLNVISDYQGGPEILIMMTGGYKKGHRSPHRNDRFKF